MKRFLGSTAAALVVTACTVTPAKEPAAVFAVSGNFRTVAECTFTSMVRKETAIRMTNLESQRLVRLYFADQGVYGWDADFIDAGESTTVEIRTIAFGRTMIVDRIRSAVDGCTS